MRIIIGERWTGKYKKSIDCNNPKGFSQKAHCAGRKARQAGRDTKSEPVDEEIMPVSFDDDQYYFPEEIEDAPPVQVYDEELDRCARIAKRKYKVWPSAYASGAAVKCRQGKIWKDVKEEIEEEKEYKPRFDREEKEGLHGWFARNRGKGWVNCRTGGPCGRESADEGGKYPACRPTLAQCKSAGRGPLRKKKSSKPISWTPKKESVEMDIHNLILEEFRNVKLELMSEGTRYHVETKTSLYNPIYRPGSKCFTRLMSEARQLKKLGHSFTAEEEELLETDCGKYGMYEGERVPLDVPMIEEDQIPPELADLAKKESGIAASQIEKAASALDALIGGAKTQQLQQLATAIKQPTSSDAQQLKMGGDFSQVDPKQFLSYYLTSRKIKPETLGLKPEQLTEAEYKGKQVPLGKPQRGGSKKFYVYVKDGDRVKKISFGDPNLSVKVGDPKRRASFVARHNCKEKNDRLTAGYWACRIGRYPHLTGAKQRYTWW